MSPASARSSRTTSVPRRLTASFALLVALMALVGVVGGAGVVVTGRSFDRATAVRRLQSADARALAAMTGVETSVRGYRRSPDAVLLRSYAQERRDLESALATTAGSDRDPVLARALDRQAALAERWLAGAGRDPRRPDLADTGSASTLYAQLRAANADTARRAEVLETDAVRTAERARRCALLLIVALVALAAVLGSVVAVTTTRQLTRPLRRLRATVARLTDGEHGARAPVEGPVEVRSLAASVNALAQEGERLRFRQDEAERLRRLARDIGRQIRDHNDVDELLAEAAAALGIAFRLDRVYVNGVPAPGATTVAQEWTHPAVAPVPGGPDPHERESQWAHDAFTTDAVLVSSDLAHDPRFATDWGRRFREQTGARGLLAVAFGDRTEALGTLTLMVLAPGRAWSEEEVAAVQQIGADLGRGFVQARQYGQQLEVVARLRELDRTRSDFLSTVSHELRTPLTSIAGYLELIRDGDAGDVPGEVDALLAVVDRNAHRLTALIEDLLTISRIESGAFKVALGEIDLAAVLTSCSAAAHEAATAAHLELELDPGPAGLLVEGDHDQLRRAVLHLVANAVKFTPAGGRVAVRARAESGTALIEVTDTGIGVPAAEQPRLFSGFFRATNATDRAIQGTGFGLTIVAAIVEHHLGRLELHSREGVGTSVRACLPLLPARTAALVPAQTRGTGAAGPAFSGIQS